MSSKNIVLTTLAIRQKYRRLATLLAQDALKLSSDISFIILTDQPNEFVGLKNVISVKHKVDSIGIYHDKRYCLLESLKFYETCIFLDADCRLFKNVVVSRPWKNGITAKSCTNLFKHISKQKTHIREIKDKLLTNIKKKYNINNLEDCNFIHESFFVVKKDELKHEKFLEIWNEIRMLYEKEGIYDGEGEVIGIAAHLSNFKIFHYDTGYPEISELHRIDDVYKDKYFLTRKNLDGEIAIKFTEFEQERKKIENNISLVQKAMQFLNLKSIQKKLSSKS